MTVRRVTRPSFLKYVDVVPPFQNPDYLDGITRIKLKVRDDAVSGGTTWTLELVNAKGARVCSERAVEAAGPEHIDQDESNLAHLGCLPDLNTKSAEVLCLEGFGLWDGRRGAINNLKSALGHLRGLTTIILPPTAAMLHLLALNLDSEASHPYHSPSVHTLVIHSETDNRGWPHNLQTLLTVARRRKAAGCPFRSVSLFLLHDMPAEWVLDQLRGCIERFEVNVGTMFWGGMQTDIFWLGA